MSQSALSIHKIAAPTNDRASVKYLDRKLFIDTIIQKSPNPEDAINRLYDLALQIKGEQHNPSVSAIRHL